MDTFINWNIMRNPYNWVICYLMVMFASLAIAYIMQKSVEADAAGN